MGRRQSAHTPSIPSPPPGWGSHILRLGSLIPNFPSAPHADPPSVSAVHAVVLAAVGQEAVLACEASGVPPPRVIWYRGTWGGERGLRNCPAGALGEQPLGWGVRGETAHFSSPHPPPTVHAQELGAGLVPAPWAPVGEGLGISELAPCLENEETPDGGEDEMSPHKQSV